MSNIKEKLKIDNLIMTKLDASNVRRLICDTNKGKLELCALKGGNQYYLTLDSVPCEKELNDTLMDILFKPEVPHVSKFTGFDPLVAKTTQKVLDNAVLDVIAPKKKGRPKGSRTGKVME